MGSVDFVVSVRTNDEQEAIVGIEKHQSQKTKRWNIGPLQIVDEEHQGVSRTAEH